MEAQCILPSAADPWHTMHIMARVQIRVIRLPKRHSTHTTGSVLVTVMAGDGERVWVRGAAERALWSLAWALSDHTALPNNWYPGQICTTFLKTTQLKNTAGYKRGGSKDQMKIPVPHPEGTPQRRETAQERCTSRRVAQHRSRKYRETRGSLAQLPRPLYTATMPTSLWKHPWIIFIGWEKY